MFQSVGVYATALQEAVMKLAQVRKLALALPEVTQAPHHHFSSFRVRGKIFITVPPEETYIHLFVNEMVRERALALEPDVVEKLFWGGKVLGLRLTLAKAKSAFVQQLVSQAWANKAPKSLAAPKKPRSGSAATPRRPPRPRC